MDYSLTHIHSLSDLLEVFYFIKRLTTITKYSVKVNHFKNNMFYQSSQEHLICSLLRWAK